MKKIIIIFIIVSATCLIMSCNNKNDDANNINTNDTTSTAIQTYPDSKIKYKESVPEYKMHDNF